MEFKAFIRFLLAAILDAVNETDEALKEDKMNRIFENLQRILED